MSVLSRELGRCFKGDKVTLASNGDTVLNKTTGNGNGMEKGGTFAVCFTAFYAGSGWPLRPPMYVTQATMGGGGGRDQEKQRPKRKETTVIPNNYTPSSEHQTQNAGPTTQRTIRQQQVLPWARGWHL